MLPKAFPSDCANWQSLDNLLLQWVSLMEEDYRKHSEDSGISLPENFSVSQIFGKAISARKINHSMLQAVLALKKKGKDLILAIFWPNHTRTPGRDTFKCVLRETALWAKFSPSGDISNDLNDPTFYQSDDIRSFKQLWFFSTSGCHRDGLWVGWSGFRWCQMV